MLEPADLKREIFNFLSAATEQLVRIRAREKAKLVRWTCTLHIFLSALANGKRLERGFLLKPDELNLIQVQVLPTE